jgi:adenosylcobinamide kinase/adenosylcobinamide-phosphate guanylyltransferase
LLGAGGGPLLIDCLTLWLTRTMDAHDCWTDAGWATGHAGLAAEIGALVEALRTTARDVVLVTNEVGQGVVSADPGTRRFVDEMGALNTAVAEVCDDVVWCVAGRTVRL